MTNDTLTSGSLALFLALANDADNWSGTPCWGCNVGGSKADNGNLTDLKRRGLVTTSRDDGNEWVRFTADGVTLAAAHGISV
jgi:hypothetical protein